jgi:hypothetical protein
MPFEERLKNLKMACNCKSNQMDCVVQLQLCSTCNFQQSFRLMFHDILLLSCSAEVLDKHLSMVQRDHEHKSQIVERRIRDDTALEEAKRKEQTIKEEKLRQERDRQEAEVGS